MIKKTKLQTYHSNLKICRIYFSC